MSLVLFFSKSRNIIGIHKASKKKNIKKVHSFDELLHAKYGKPDTSKHHKFDEKAQFVINELLKEARKEANMTREELADKPGTKKVMFHSWKTESVTFKFPHCIVF